MVYLCKALMKSKKFPFFTSSKNQFLFNQFWSSVPVHIFKKVVYMSIIREQRCISKNPPQLHNKVGQSYFLPIITRTASCILVRASSSTESGNVALNRDCIIEGFEQALTTESICFNIPSSNSLSDSSRTRYSTLHVTKINWKHFKPFFLQLIDVYKV